MILDHAKLGCTFTFMKNLASVVTLCFPPKTLIWAGSKSAKEDYLQKYYIHFYIQFCKDYYCKNFKRL